MFTSTHNEFSDVARQAMPGRVAVPMIGAEEFLFAVIAVWKSWSHVDQRKRATL